MIYSPTCQHALRALIYLAVRNQSGPALVREIAKESFSPQQSLSKILLRLQKSGLVKSTRGPGGGYNLARPASEIRLIEIIRAVDGSVDLDKVCILGLDHCGEEETCALHAYWSSFREEYNNTISCMTLSEAAETLMRKRRMDYHI
jgi:Rrf2 family iron-sulfur cluster assembly transcriptional regulator